MNRNLVIAASVVVFHLAALWALQTGLLRRTVELVVPVALLSEMVTPPAPPAPTVPSAEPPRPQEPHHRPEPRRQAPPSVPTPSPIAPTPAPTAPAIAEPVAPAAVAPAAPAPAPAPAPPARIDLPSSNAAYLSNPKPAYPSISMRLGEQGKVVVRVLIGADGTPQKAEVHSSSGYERLDQAAVATVLRWRYVPGKRNGVPEAMWFNVPINFVLE